MHIITGLPQIGFDSGVMIGEEEWRLRSMDGGEGAAGSEQRQPHTMEVSFRERKRRLFQSGFFLLLWTHAWLVDGSSRERNHAGLSRIVFSGRKN